MGDRRRRVQVEYRIQGEEVVKSFIGSTERV